MNLFQRLIPRKNQIQNTKETLNDEGIEDNKKEKFQVFMNSMYMSLNSKLREDAYQYQVKYKGCSQEEYSKSLAILDEEKKNIADIFGRGRKELDKLYNRNFNNNQELKGSFDQAFLELQERADLRHELRVKGYQFSEKRFNRLRELEIKYKNKAGSLELRNILKKFEYISKKEIQFNNPNNNIKYRNIINRELR